MAAKDRSQWSEAYRQRIERGEAKGLSKQEARGHKTPPGVTEYKQRVERYQKKNPGATKAEATGRRVQRPSDAWRSSLNWLTTPLSEQAKYKEQANKYALQTISDKIRELQASGELDRKEAAHLRESVREFRRLLREQDRINTRSIEYWQGRNRMKELYAEFMAEGLIDIDDGIEFFYH